MNPTDHWTLLMTVVVSASFALGLVTQLTAYDKEERARRSQLSAFGGLLVGSLASAQQDGDLTVAFAGLLGGGCGAAAGWGVVLLISWAAETWERRSALVFLTGGPSGVTKYLEQLDLKQELSSELKERKLVAVRTWGIRYGQMIRESRSALDKVGDVDPATVEAVLKLWLRAMVDGFNYLMTDLPAVERGGARRSAVDTDGDGDGDGPESEYRVRASLIKFEDGEENGYTGSHWIAYAGTGPAHSKEPLREDSTAWKVAAKEIGSPCVPEQPREKREDAKQRYDRYMVALVLEKRLVISVDWFRLTEYVETLQAVAEGQLAGQVADLLTRHHPGFAPDA